MWGSCGHGIRVRYEGQKHQTEVTDIRGLEGAFQHGNGVVLSSDIAQVFRSTGRRVLD